MKRLLVVLFLLASSNAHAYIVSVDTVSSDISVVNNNFSNVVAGVNHIDGSTDGGSTVSNIAENSVYEINLADNANPKVYFNELIGIGADSVSGGTLTQATVVESGCVPADDSDLSSDISACVAYVNGFRVEKSAESLSYTASRDCYVDLSQSGVYNVTCVTNGATQPSVAANSARLAKVVTDATEITTVTSLYTTRVPGLIIPAHYRSGFVVSKDGATTISVFPGTAEINNSMVSKTSTTTLTISTAGDYAGGASLRAADTFGFVGIDTSGNLKLHTTAPTNDNYALSTTAGKKRYASWSSTAYRILGWFYMDGAQNVEVASNIKEGDVGNSIISSDNSTLSTTSTSYIDIAKVRFYNSGGNVNLMSIVSGDASSGITSWETVHNYGGSDISASTKGEGLTDAAYASQNVNPWLHTNVPQAANTYKLRSRVEAQTLNIRSRAYIVRED